MENKEYAKNQIVIHTLLAQLWMTRAITGEAKQRKLYHSEGSYGEYPRDEFTDAEKVAYAIEAAKRHIVLIEEINDEVFGKGSLE